MTGQFRRWILGVLLAGIALAAGRGGAAVRTQSTKLRVAAVGQALIWTDLRRAAPVAVEQARRYLADADVRFTNLETAVAPGDAAVKPRGELAEWTDPDVLDCLKAMGFNMLSLSNNHAWDLGEAGIFTTIAEVRKRGFAHAGSGADDAAAVAPGVLDTPAGRVALIAMASGGPQLTPDTWAGPRHAGVNFLELRSDGTLNAAHTERILKSVRDAARQVPYVIVYQHNHYWGDARGSGQPPDRDKHIDRFETAPWMVEWAHRLIDAGASMYVSHGDPALHGVEIYKGRPILYGLGNYIFHGAFSRDVYGPLAYMSAVAHAEFEGGRVTALSFEPIVLSFEDKGSAPLGTPYLAESAEASLILGYLRDVSRQYGTEMQIKGSRGAVVLR